MRISTQVGLATSIVFAAIGLIGAMIWWANDEVEDANRQRLQTMEISRALSDLRLVTFEYILLRQERARHQEEQVSARLERLIAANPFDDAQLASVVEGLRARTATTHRLFAELPSTLSRPDSTDRAVQQRFETQLTSRLLIYQQESTADAMRLSSSSTERITSAQRRVVLVIVAGLGLFAALAVAAVWLMRRGVLAPIARLEQAMREVAGGNWDYRLAIAGDDEIGRMSRHFEAMTGALRDSFRRIEKSNIELAALNREIEAFSYSVSHDLRSPLRSMDGFSQALMEDYAERLDEQGLDYLKRIRAASQRMARLIDELLGLSRVTRAELSIRAVNLSEMARDIAASLEKHQPHPQAQWQIDEGITVQADRALVQIAMQNLLENAWKFTSKTEHPLIRVGTEEREGQTICFVADNGVGFDMAYADRLFGAFQRLHHESEFAGTGIGLATVQRIFRRHGGSIWAKAKPDQGATFFFSLQQDGVKQ